MEQNNNSGTAGVAGMDVDRKIFVRGLTQQTCDEDLKNYFMKFGEIDDVVVKIDPHTGRSRTFGYVVFRNAQTIDSVLSSTNHYINDKRVYPRRERKTAQTGKIYVAGLIPAILDKDIFDHFSQYGSIVEINAPYDPETKQRKEFCFIEFETKEPEFRLLGMFRQNIKGQRVYVRRVINNTENPEMGPSRPVSAGWGFGGYPAGYVYPQFYSYYGNAHFNYRGYHYSGYSYITQPYGQPRGPVQHPQRYQRF